MMMPMGGLGRGVASVMRAEERHHEILRNRLANVLAVSVVLWAIGTALIWLLERHARHTEIHGLGDAAFWTAVQLLTISSQLRNPVTAAGRILDVILEAYALFVVAALAGSFSSFFRHQDAMRLQRDADGGP
jgi:hypothetical protein